MTFEKDDIQFIITNRDKINSILERYLKHLETVIRKEKELEKKGQLSEVADQVENWINLVKNLRVDNPKGKGDFTGV
jgi:hypothetical protein